ncbi:MAG TPA: proton-conducting transporter membrane subunit [Atribacteraceae bacterium]|nr:proton-conducting transporter membrane subunit [Atribacteraceae bacterium]
MIIPSLVILPLVVGLLLTLVGRKNPRFSEGAALLTTGLVVIFSILLIPGINRTGSIVYEFSGWSIPYGIAFVFDHLSAFFVLIVGVLTFCAILYSLATIRKYGGTWNYYSLIMFLVAGMNNIVLTGDLFNLFVFMEITLFASYALVAFQGRAEQFEAAFKYAIMGFISSTFILIGIGSLYNLFSTLTLMHISSLLTTTPALNLVFALFLVGFGFKAALFPFHFWLPDVHSSAPTPVSALLSGVLVKVLGAYGLLRLFYTVFGAPRLPLELLVVLGITTLLIGALMALPQQDIKRMLAYSSVSSMGYILFACGLGTPLGVLGALYHMLNHSLSKSLLFLNAGEIERAEGTRRMDLMQGKSGRFLYTTSWVGILGISGVPPFGGFFSKLIIVLAAVQAGKTIFAVIAVAASVLTLAYYLAMMGKVFPKGPPSIVNHLRSNYPITLSMTILVVLSLAAPLLFLPGVREITLERVVTTIFNREAYIALLTLGGSK